MQRAPKSIAEGHKGFRAPNGVAPQFHPLRDAWLRVVDAIVRVRTLGKGRVSVPRHRAPVHWDGVIR